MLPDLSIVRLGRVPYDEAWALQRRLHAARVADDIPDVLLLLEHPPTITHSFTGRGLQHLLASPEVLVARGVELQPTDRGGDITFHGPGQLVGYPIVRLEPRDLHAYLRRLEEALIATADRFAVRTERVEGRTGTWLPDGSRKLAAIGVKVARWTSQHGFAMNVSTDLSFFDLIVPCGIADAGVTSLRRELGAAAPSMQEVMDVAGQEVARALQLRPAPPTDAMSELLSSSSRSPSSAS